MESARELIERCRWPEGVTCPRCAGEARRLSDSGLFQCRECRGRFSATAGTVFAHSRVPLEHWVAAIREACSPEGVNAAELEQLAGVTYKSAVAMMRRLRDAGERAGIARNIRRGYERRLSLVPTNVEEALRGILKLPPETSDERLERAWSELKGRRLRSARPDRT